MLLHACVVAARGAGCRAAAGTAAAAESADDVAADGAVAEGYGCAMARRSISGSAGYDAIAKTVDAFLPNLIAVLPKLGTMATGLADASKVRNRQMIVDQICMLTGGPCIFVGRPNDVTHQGLQHHAGGLGQVAAGDGEDARSDGREGSGQIGAARRDRQPQGRHHPEAGAGGRGRSGQ